MVFFQLSGPLTILEPFSWCLKIDSFTICFSNYWYIGLFVASPWHWSCLFFCLECPPLSPSKSLALTVPPTPAIHQFNPQLFKPLHFGSLHVVPASTLPCFYLCVTFTSVSYSLDCEFWSLVPLSHSAWQESVFFF